MGQIFSLLGGGKKTEEKKNVPLHCSSMKRMNAPVASKEVPTLVHPDEEFAAKAHVKDLAQYEQMYRQSLDDPEAFWGKIAEDFYWEKKWETGKSNFMRSNIDLDKGPVSIEWFRGAKTNLCYNAVDRHAAKKPNEKAILWEGNDLNQDRVVTWSQLKDDVCRLANWLKNEAGAKQGDCVMIYLPMLPELPESMLACARIGAVHTVVFAGFSSDAVASRVEDSNPVCVLTATGTMRGAKPIPVKGVVDAGLAICEKDGVKVPSKLLVIDHPAMPVDGGKVAWNATRDVKWQDAVAKQSADCAVTWMDAEAPLFRLYTSGSTGKPKGVLHSTAGYMVGASTTFKYIFDYKEDDVYFCTADAGWITGHSYLAYGPLINGATCVVFEGVPSYPDNGRFWDICQKYQVTLFYTAPTAIRALMRYGDDIPKKYDLSSIRLLGSVGEPINPEAWRWYNDVIGGGRCPIVDTWWQTETGAIMITPLPGGWAQKPGSATLPFFGVEPAVLDEKGNELTGACEGMLCMKRSWPSCMRTVAGDHARFEATYFAPFKGYYFTGDGCKRDKDGFYWITGRVDDVINVSGHRIGTAEVESALVGHPDVAEAAVVGFDHAIKGQGIYAFVTLMEGKEESDATRKALVTEVRRVIGAFAAPDVIHWAPGLPKTRSGKIMRRVLRKIAAKEEGEIGDTSTLADPSVVDALIANRGK